MSDPDDEKASPQVQPDKPGDDEPEAGKDDASEDRLPGRQGSPTATRGDE